MTNDIHVFLEKLDKAIESDIEHIDKLIKFYSDDFFDEVIVSYWRGRRASLEEMYAQLDWLAQEKEEEEGDSNQCQD